MRIALVTLSIATLCVAGYALMGIRERRASPTIDVNGGIVFDAGTVRGTQPVTHTFKIDNPNPFTIGLSTPQAGCTCTTASVSMWSIPPHGSASVTLKVDPEDGNLSGSASIVTTHNGRHVETELFVTGQVAGKGTASH